MDIGEDPAGFNRNSARFANSIFKSDDENLMLDVMRIFGLVVAWQEVCHEFKLLLSRMETCGSVYLFFFRAGTLVIGRRAENKARQQSATAYKGRCKGNSADVQDTFKFYKTGN